MKKKIFIVQMLDSKNPSGKSFTQVNDALFYSNDTDAHLVFLPHEQERFEFNEATVALYNIDDESLVERPAVIETFEGRKSVVLKMTEDLLAHWGRWQAQVVFKQGDKINTSVVVKFDTLRYMLDQRPPTLRDVVKVDELYSQLVTVMDEISGKDVISAPEIILARGGHETLGARLDETTAQLAQTQSQKVDKNGSGQVKWANIAQDARENISGDKVAVVGVNSVGADNIIDDSVSFNKLVKRFRHDASTNILDLDTDLNTIKDEGNYLTVNRTGNKPDGTSNTSVLVVFAINNNFTVQIYLDIHNNLYWRMYGATAPTGWRSWKKAIDETRLIEEIEKVGIKQYPYLTSEDDLNDLTKDGKWIAIAPLNNPTGSTGLTWTITVQTYKTDPDNPNTWGTQLATSIQGSHEGIYIRRFNKSGSNPAEFHNWVNLNTGNHVEGHLQGKKIVNFADSIFGNYQAPNDVSSYIAERTGSEVINVGFGGCRMSSHGDHWDAFSMYRLADSITSGNFGLQNQALIDGSDSSVPAGYRLPSYFEERLNTLKSLNFNEVEYITISYGQNDYTAGKTIDNSSDLFDVSTYKGALRHSLKTILETYPNLKILITAPAYCFWYGDDGAFLEDGFTREYNGNTLVDFVNAGREVSQEIPTVFLDVFHDLGINKFNRTEYFSSTDGIHLALNGRKRLGYRIGSALISEF